MHRAMHNHALGRKKIYWGYAWQDDRGGWGFKDFFSEKNAGADTLFEEKMTRLELLLAKK